MSSYFCKSTGPHLTLSNQSNRSRANRKSLSRIERWANLWNSIFWIYVEASATSKVFGSWPNFCAILLSLLLDRYLAMTYKRKSQKIPFQYWVSCTFQLQQTQLFASMILSETLWREWSTIARPLISIHVWFLFTTFCNHRGGVELKAYWKFPNLVG